MERNGGGERLQCRLPSRVLQFFQRNRFTLHTVRSYRGTNYSSSGRTPPRLTGRQREIYGTGRLLRQSGTMGRLPLRPVRRMGEARCGDLLHPALRLHPCQLGRRTARCMLHGKDLRTCRCNGIQRRRICLRPFCIP